MQVERPAAFLRPRHHHVVARRGEEPRGVRVDVGIEEALRAAEQQAGAAAAGPARRDQLRQRRARRAAPRGSSASIARSFLNGAEQAEPAHHRLQARPLVQAERVEHGAEPAGMRKGPEDEAQGGAVARGSGDPAALELTPGGLEELAERHAGGTGRLAGATAEAEIQVARHGGREPDPVLGRRAHEIDPAARRVHLLAEDAVGRALRQADPAVHAGAQAVHGGRVLGVEGPEAGADGMHLAHRPPTKRPGLSRPAGSNSRLDPGHDRQYFRLYGTPDITSSLKLDRPALDGQAAAFRLEGVPERLHQLAHERDRRRPGPEPRAAARRVPAARGA